MDKKEAAKMMLDTVRLLGTFAKIIDPDANHITCYSIDGSADFSVYAGDKKIFDAHYFEDDGTIRVDEEYIWKTERIGKGEKP